MDSKDNKNRRFNRLKDSSSPYLLKHAANPVDWFEWGPEALEKSGAEDKLIFLSIGYTACHWCNELEKECFDHHDFANVINERYVCVKVDREQRPDLDRIYMDAAVAMQGAGGWPNNVFLTPDLDPVLAVGYRKREEFKELLVKVHDYWRGNREKVAGDGRRIRAALKTGMEAGGSYEKAGELEIEPIRRSMDTEYGGFGTQQKFPVTPILEYLLVSGGDDDFLKTTLGNMSRGGMFDHVGGGFHRYAVDRRWEIPHFEKMLYDNALLAGLYARASLIQDEPEYAHTARRTLQFILDELENGEGGFMSSLDADTEGQEGKFYLWTYGELVKQAGEEFARDYGATPEGNMYDVVFGDTGPRRELTGTNVLARKSGKKHEDTLAKLRRTRAERVHPALDDKVVSAWHAMAVSAFAVAGVALDDGDLIGAAERGARFTLDKLGRSHAWRAGQAEGAATLDDMAFTAGMFWDLFEVTGKGEYLEAAVDYADDAVEKFAAGDGGYFMTEELEDLIIRPRVVEDNPLPSSAARLARADLRLAAALGRPERAERARRTADHLLGRTGGANLFAGEAMALKEEADRGLVEIVYAFAADESGGRRWLRSGYGRAWGAVRIPLGEAAVAGELSEGRWPTEKSAAYVCLNGACLEPAQSPDELSERLATVRRR